MQLMERQPNDFCRGRVELRWRKPNGEFLPITEKPNVITYSAADIMANLLTGNQAYVPTHIAYIYGPAAGSIQNPSTASPKREHPWSAIASDVEALAGNAILSPLVAAPLIQVDGDTDLYAGNAVTLSAISDQSAAVVFQGGGYAVVGPQPTTDKYFQVVLVSRVRQIGSSTPLYIPFARTQLAAGNDGLVVQSDFELAVFWTISFK